MTLQEQPLGLASLLIDGDWLVGAGGQQTVRAPYSGREMTTLSLASPEQAAAAVKAAAAAYTAFRRTPAFERAALLENVSRLLAAGREQLARVLAEEVGKPLKLARAEIDRSVASLKMSAEEARRLNGEVVALDAMPGGAGKKGLTLVEPVGVVTCITPFNYPINQLMHKAGPALAAGNTVVIKPSPKAALSTALMTRLFVEAGYPPGTVNFVPCDPAAAEVLTTHPEVAVVSFTGSTAVGTTVLRQAGMKRVVLELGSNAGNIVTGTADLAQAARALAAGSMVYTGQSCIAVQRIYVHRSVSEAFTALLAAEVGAMKVGDPLDEEAAVGPVIDEDAARRLESWVREAEAQGARAVTGGRREGTRFEPTVLADVTADMRVVCEEVFGPVVSVLAYDDFGEALAAVNASRYGLHAGVFTGDLAEGLRAMKELEVAGVVLNDPSTFRSDIMPYEGVRESGLGREGIRYALAEMVRLKSVYLPW